jgi:hypothetical protein
MDDDLHDRLLELVKEHNTEMKKKIKTRKMKNKKNVTRKK